MKIVQCCHTTSGGHWQYVEQLALEESRLGAGVEVMVLAGRDAPSSEIPVLPLLSVPDTEAVGVRRVLDRFAVYLSQAPQTTNAVALVVQELQPTIVHFQELPSLFPRRSVEGVRKLGATAVVTVHNVVPHGRPTLAERLQERSRRRAWRSADLLITHSESLRCALAELLGDGCPPIAVVLHPVWSVKRAEVEPALVRDFLLFGHLRENKGVFDFIDALREAGDPSASIIGSADESMRRRVCASVRAAGLQNCVVRTEFVADEEIGPIFAAHRVVVAPYSQFGAQSGVTHLAIAYDRPVVVTDVGGLGDPVREHGIGEIVASVGTLAATMTRVRDAASADVYADALKRARDASSISRIAAATYNAYAKTLSMRPGFFPTTSGDAT